MNKKAVTTKLLIGLILMLCSLGTIYSCCLQGKYIEKDIGPHAKHLPRNSFTLVEVSHKIVTDSCVGTMKQCAEFQKGVTLDTLELRGSGAVIAHEFGLSYVLTAAHVCDQTFPTQVKVGDVLHKVKIESKIIFYDLHGSGHEGKIVYADHKNDICIVKSPGIWGTPASIAKDMVEPGERVFNIAAPFGIYSPGMALTFQGFYSGQDMRGNEFYSVPARPGSSGSPIFNSNGEIVSVVHSASVRFEHLALGSRLKVIQDAVNEYIPREKDMEKHIGDLMYGIPSVP